MALKSKNKIKQHINQVTALAPVPLDRIHPWHPWPGRTWPPLTSPTSALNPPIPMPEPLRPGVCYSLSLKHLCSPPGSPWSWPQRSWLSDASLSKHPLTPSGNPSPHQGVLHFSYKETHVILQITLLGLMLIPPLNGCSTGGGLCMLSVFPAPRKNTASTEWAVKIMLKNWGWDGQGVWG